MSREVAGMSVLSGGWPSSLAGTDLLLNPCAWLPIPRSRHNWRGAMAGSVVTGAGGTDRWKRGNIIRWAGRQWGMGNGGETQQEHIPPSCPPSLTLWPQYYLSTL